MDPARFDTLTRKVAATRRNMLGPTLGGLFGGLAFRGLTRAAPAPVGATPAGGTPAATPGATPAAASICSITNVPDLQSREPGDLIAFEEITPSGDSTFPPGARAWRVLYVSTGRDNDDRTLSCGNVVAPAELTGIALHDANGAPAARVVAWAHGTLGIQQHCQPSENPALELWGAPPFGINRVAWGNDANGDAHAGPQEDGILAGMIAEGWIVAATDFANDRSAVGGLQPFVLGKVEAANTIDSVRAAHHLLAAAYDGYTGAAYDVVTWGHSQGGHAAMWAGQLLASYETATHVPGGPALALAGVAVEAPASNLITQPALQGDGALDTGLFDWTVHHELQLTGQPVAIPLAPFFFSYIFQSWAWQSEAGTPDSTAMPAYPETGPLVVSAVATDGARQTIDQMIDLCWTDGAEVATLALPYATDPFFVPALSDGNVIGDLQHGRFDRTCAGNPSPELAKWCDWFRYNEPGPRGVNPLDKIPTRNGQPVPVLITAGTNDGVVHCIAPDPTADAVPGADDCAPRALYDALAGEYCPDGGDAGYLSLMVWRKQDGVTVADHSDVTGLIAAASTDDPRFHGSPLERFFTGAFEGTLTPGCSAVVANGSARA